VDSIADQAQGGFEIAVGGCESIGVDGDEVVHHRIKDAHELAQAEAVVQAAHRRLARQRGICGAGRGFADEHLQHRIMAQQVAVIAIGITADHLHDTLGEQLLRAVLWRTRLALTG